VFRRDIHIQILYENLGDISRIFNALIIRIAYVEIMNVNESLNCVIIKITVFWYATPLGLIVTKSFGGTCCLHLQGRRVSQENGMDTGEAWT
jgi:hypothetical protein